MRVLHVADFLPQTHAIAGGAEFAARRIIEEQIAAGIEVEVATLPIEFPEAPRPWPIHHELRNLDRFAPRLAYAIKQLYFPGDLRAARALRAIIRRSRPDLVHFHNLHFAGLSVLREARSAGIPSVWSIYDYWLFCPSFMLLTNKNEICTLGHGAHCVNCIGTRRARALKPLKEALFGLRPAVFGGIASTVDRMVVLSDASRDLMIRLGVGSSRIAVLPQYVWKEAVQEAAVPAAVPPVGRLVYVGWVEQRKGLHVVIEALGAVAAEFPDAHLEVLGMPANADYQAQIESRVHALGLDARVRFRGKLARAELLAALRTAFLVTVPEQWENMSPVILTEAMAAGACVLASRVGGIRHFVQEFESGLLAGRNDVAEFAERIRWAMRHPEEVRRIGRRAHDRARELFDPATINRQTFELYNSLVIDNRKIATS